MPTQHPHSVNWRPMTAVLGGLVLLAVIGCVPLAAPTPTSTPPRSLAVVANKASYSDGRYLVTWIIPGSKEQGKYVTAQCYGEAAIGKPLPESCQADPKPPTPTPFPTSTPPPTPTPPPDSSIKLELGFKKDYPKTGQLAIVYVVLNSSNRIADGITLTLTLADESHQTVWSDFNLGGSYVEFRSDPGKLSQVSWGSLPDDSQRGVGYFTAPTGMKWAYASIRADYLWCNAGKCVPGQSVETLPYSYP